MKVKPKYYLQDDGTFIIENYSLGQPFSSFLPGISGLRGIPMWVFYCNRGQGVAAFGVQNKDYSIMEFNPAVKSYGLAPYLGFRTFMKVKKAGKTVFYEPFLNDASSSSYKTTQKMYIRPHEVLFEETNTSLGIKTLVRYFTLPEEPRAALVRIVEFENISRKPLSIEVIDGLPRIIPYFVNEFLMKSITNTSMAWATVTNFNKTGIPFYKTKVEINDQPEVYVMKKGNFYFGLLDNKGKAKKTDVIIDPDIVFGEDKGFRSPNAFLRDKVFSLPKKQYGDNKYASAMSYFKLNLKPKAKETLYSMAGHIASEAELNSYFKKISKDKNYFESKIETNKNVIESITNNIYTKSGIKEFDMYCQTTYLDNVLRGGLPILLKAKSKELVYYVYSRKHGDLERDYNNFQISPSYYSQGNANFRDINQNKRNDVLFNPKIGDCNVLSFYNLIQLDGFNPLLIKGMSFFLNADEDNAAKLIKSAVNSEYIEKMKDFFKSPFEPGDLLLFIEKEKIKLKMSNDEFFANILEIAHFMDNASHGEAWHGSGYWVDHWTYNLDLLENFLAVYPEEAQNILLNKREFTYYDNPFVVVPRSERYVEAEPGKIRQFGSVVLDKGKHNLIKHRTFHNHVMREHGHHGKIYKTTLAEKIICLILNKLASLDSEGIGVELEGDKPGWYDALNGLSGIFGSSLPETFELKRMIQFMIDKLGSFDLESNYGIPIASEIYGFYSKLDSLLSKKEKNAYDFWDKASILKEGFRTETINGVSGNQKSLTYSQLNAFLKKALVKIDKGIRKAYDSKTGLYYTYYSFEADKYKKSGKTSHQGLPCVSISKFKKRPLAMFLEGEVRYMKTEKSIEKVRKLHKAVKSGPLYDRQLNMYKLNASLTNESTDIGRCTVFAPGWLENESIWTHMEYKYILELIRAGLFAEFFKEFKKVGTCFLDPSVYGRSILENSSFIVSSAFPDKNMWGRGCVARLSGCTAEFLEIWLLMTIGPKPFYVNKNNELQLEFKPAIAKEYFNKNNMFTFKFLGETLVTYRNSKKVDTFSDKFKVNKIEIKWANKGKDVLTGSVIPEKFAVRVRNQEAEHITLWG